MREVDKIVQVRQNGTWHHVKMQSSLFEGRSYTQDILMYLAQKIGWSITGWGDIWKKDIAPELHNWYQSMQDCDILVYCVPLSRLIEFDYNTALPCEGFKWDRETEKEYETYNDVFLETNFFQDLDILKKLGNPDDVCVLFYRDW